MKMLKARKKYVLLGFRISIVTDIAAGFQAPVRDGGDAAERAVALELHLECLVLLHALGDQQTASDGPSERSGRKGIRRAPQACDQQRR